MIPEYLQSTQRVYSLFACLFFFLCSSVAFSQTGPIKVHLKYGPPISTNYVYLNSNGGFSSSYVRIHDQKGRKIPINQVTHVEGVDQKGAYKYYVPIRMMGREIWAERTYTSDRIEVYYTNVISGTWTTSYKSKYFQYSKDGGALQKLTYRNLRIDLADNEASVAHLKKGNALRIGQIIFYGLGTALIVSAMANTFNDDELSDPNNTSIKVPPGLIAGAAALYIPWFMNSSKQKQFVNALEAYE